MPLSALLTTALQSLINGDNGRWYRRSVDRTVDTSLGAVPVKILLKIFSVDSMDEGLCISPFLRVKPYLWEDGGRPAAFSARASRVG